MGLVIAFWILAVVGVAAALAVVLLQNVFRAALALVLCLMAVAGIYVTLSADFLAAVQILIYVGGILVLLLFGVMLSQKIGSVEMKTGTLQILPAALVVAGIFAILIRVFSKTNWHLTTPGAFEPTTEKIGILLMTDYLIPFEIVSVLLLGALIGAAYIARKEEA